MDNKYPILDYFKDEHWPERMRVINPAMRYGGLRNAFSELAEGLAQLPRGAEVSAGLRKLLEAKDCAIRAALTKPPE